MKLPSYFVQSLSGRDHARGDRAAAQMVNLAYLVGDREAGECVLVDPSWDPLGLVQRAEQDGMRVVGSIVTHYHGDHAGGNLWGHRVPGVPELVRAGLGPVHVHRADAALLMDRCELSPDQLEQHDEGSIIRVGALEVTVWHTPGHSPGSACYVAEQALISGDTLFIQGCGRVDLDTSDPQAMATSLRRLAAVQEPYEVFPGHDYGGVRASLQDVQRDNPVFGMW